MTENKRYSFNWERGHPNFWDNHCDLADCYLTCEDVVDLLNELHEENKGLQSRCNQIQEGAGEFYRIARENANMVVQLKKENKELKEENKQLKRHMKSAKAHLEGAY